MPEYCDRYLKLPGGSRPHEKIINGLANNRFGSVGKIEGDPGREILPVSSCEPEPGVGVVKVCGNEAR